MTASALTRSPRQAVDKLNADIVKPARLLVAVSGGSDSIGLLLALAKFADPEIRIAAATVDHRLRPESAAEAQAVARYCSRLDVPHFLRRWQGNKPETGISAAAREARYRLLVEMADEFQADAILTGHTCDDQAETVAMRAARSDSEDNPGLAGMAGAVLLERRYWLLRPFLRTSRAEIRAFLKAEGQGWIDDPSNIDPHYERVRVRGTLAAANRPDEALPVHGKFDGAAVRRIALSDAAARLVHDHVTVRHAVLAHMAPEALRAEPETRRRALSLLAAVLGGRAHGPAGDSMDRIIEFIGCNEPGRMTAGRVIFDLRRNGLYITREGRGLLPQRVPAGQSVVWDGRFRVSNHGCFDLTVGPTVADRQRAAILFADISPAIALRAMTAMPLVGDGPADSDVRIVPVLAPFDCFLPQFDIRIGEVLADLFGCGELPPLPINE